MKISKESAFQPVTIILETEHELNALKNIIEYMNGYQYSSPFSSCVDGYRYTQLSQTGRKMYYSLKSGL